MTDRKSNNNVSKLVVRTNKKTIISNMNTYYFRANLLHIMLKHPFAATTYAQSIGPMLQYKNRRGKLGVPSRDIMRGQVDSAQFARVRAAYGA